MDLLFPIFRVVVDKLNTKIALFYKKEALYNLSYKFAHCQAVVNAIKDLSSSGKGLLVPLDDDCELLWDVAKIICVDDSLHDELPDKVMLARNGKWCQIDGDIQKLVNSCLAG